MLDRLLSSDLVWRLGWTLLHSLWQLLLLGAATTLLLALLSRRSAKVKYWIACGGLALCYAPLLASFLLIPPRPDPETALTQQVIVTTPGVVPSSGAPLNIGTAFEPSDRPAETPPAVHGSAPTIASELQALVKKTPPIAAQLTDAQSRESALVWQLWVVGGWVSIVGLLLIFNLGGWFVVRRLKRNASVSSRSDVITRLRELAERMRVRQPVRLLESLHIDTPMTIGWLRPVVLLPASLATGLSPAELDAVLAHELAHIRRYDYFVNLLQVFTETLLFYHPAVWLLSRRIRIEREYCCDDEAIAVCGNKADYARALTAVETNRPATQFAMFFWGRSKHMTLNRVRRIMGVRTGLPNAWLNGSGALLLIAVISAVALTQIKGEAARGKPDGWGKATDGVQIRLRPDRVLWKEGETVAFKADVRNRGTRELLVTQAQQPCEIEFDGKWYSWSDGFSLKSSPLPPKKKYKGIRVSLVELWKSKAGDALPLTVGKHAVRLAFPARAPNSKVIGALPPVRAISNRVEIEIVHGDNPARFAWGEERNGLKTRLTAKTRVFRAGHAVSLKLEVTNAGRVARKYERSSVTRNDQFEVLDGAGNPVPYLAGLAQLRSQQIEIPPGETQVVASFNLADSYFVRLAGEYSVKYRGRSLPPSGTWKFEVVPDRATDRDPIGPLLSLVKKNWRLVSRPHVIEQSPGANWLPTRCRVVSFRLDPPRSKIDFDFVRLYLAESAAKPQRPEVTMESSAPSTEYLGKLAHWHVYSLVSEGALKAWPNVKDDIKRAMNTVDVASSKTVQQQQSQAGAGNATDDAAAVDLKSFRLDVKYEGASGKPYYNATLHTGGVADNPQPFSIGKPLDAFRAKRILAWLKRSGFFAQARADKKRAKPVDREQQYILRVTSAGKVFEENIGWDLPMLLRLDSLNRVFDEQPEPLKDAQAASPLDPLISRLAGERRMWLNGNVVNDLKYRLTSQQEAFIASGKPVKLTLDVTNTGEQNREYSAVSVSNDDIQLKVFDEFGRSVPYVGGPAQLPEQRKQLAPGATEIIETFDLAQFRYLRKPGMYTVYFGRRDARSNHLTFHVTPGTLNQADLVGQLLPLVHDEWELIANPNFRGTVRPGVNYKEVPGQRIFFQDSPTGSKRDIAIISLWFTDVKAKPHVPGPKETYPPASDYVGKVGRWHLYAHLDEPGKKRWPGIVDDVRRALRKKVQKAAGRGVGAWSRPQQGVVGRLVLTNPVISESDRVQLHLELRNTNAEGGETLAVRIADPNLFTARVTSVDGKPPVQHQPDVGFPDNGEWVTLAPGSDAPLSTPVSVPTAFGALDTSTRMWTLEPGRYQVAGTYSHAATMVVKSFAGTEKVWTGKLELPPVALEVRPDAHADRLRPLTKNGWKFTASDFEYSISPGSNWKDGDGYVMTFVHNPPATRDDSGLIQVWLMRNEVEPQVPAVARFSSAESSEYCGRIPHWHVYMTASENALKAWPTAKTDILHALGHTTDSAQRRESTEKTRKSNGPTPQDDAALRRSVSKADLVIVGKIVDRPPRMINEEGVASDITNVEISRVLKGGARFTNSTLLMSISRNETEDIKNALPIEQGTKCILFVKSLGVGVKPNFASAEDRDPIRRPTPQLIAAITRIVKDEQSVSDDFYRVLHDRYKRLVHKAAMAGKRDEIARLTTEFNQSIGGRLAYAKVTPRKGPIEQHQVLFSKFYVNQKMTFGKVSHRPDTKPHVWRSSAVAGANEFVFVETNRTINLGLIESPWPNDLQVQLVVSSMSDQVVHVGDQPEFVRLMGVFREQATPENASPRPVAWLSVSGKHTGNRDIRVGQLVWIGGAFPEVKDIRDDKVELAIGSRSAEWKVGQNLVGVLASLNRSVD